MPNKVRLSGAAYLKKAKEKADKLSGVIEKSAKISTYFKTTVLSGDNSVLFYYYNLNKFTNFLYF